MSILTPEQLNMLHRLNGDRALEAAARMGRKSITPNKCRTCGSPILAGYGGLCFGCWQEQERQQDEAMRHKRLKKDEEEG